MNNSIFNEVVARAFKTAAVPSAVVPENVIRTTAYEYQWWHIDRVFEQAKVMILASDVGERNGPMKIIPGSHRFEGSRRTIEFSYFREGADFLTSHGA
jgi:ectoine hydroxylase-related dioxygenase (phytanoyl-CoA dioxygenase family)